MPVSDEKLSPPPSDQLQDKNYYCNDDYQMDKSAARSNAADTDAQSPQYQQYQHDCPKHTFSPLILRTNLTLPKSYG
jgi:hypothetical protein